jgi:hypothetical protein
VPNHTSVDVFLDGDHEFDIIFGKKYNKRTQKCKTRARFGLKYNTDALFDIVWVWPENFGQIFYVARFSNSRAIFLAYLEVILGLISGSSHAIFVCGDILKYTCTEKVL